MPTHLNLRHVEIEELWPHITRFQNLAEKYGIPDIFMDGGGKMLQLAIATGLDICPGRTGPDAVDRVGNVYEVKTTDVRRTSNGFSTANQLKKHTIDGFRSRRWVFAVYDGITLLEAYLVEPAALETIFGAWEANIESIPGDFLNNPKISLGYVRKIGTTLYMKDVPPPWALGISEAA